jgi:hypothetical protein
VNIFIPRNDTFHEFIPGKQAILLSLFLQIEESQMQSEWPAL